jgi:hypothetical protein
MFQLPDTGICPEASKIKYSTKQNFTDTEAWLHKSQPTSAGINNTRERYKFK